MTLPTLPRPAVEMFDEDEPRGWLRKDAYPTRSVAKQWAVGELGIEWTDVRVRTTWLRGIEPAEEEYTTWGGIGALKGSPGAEEFWEVRDRRV